VTNPACESGRAAGEVFLRTRDMWLGAEVGPSVTCDVERAAGLRQEPPAARSEGEPIGIPVLPDATVLPAVRTDEKRGCARLPGPAAVAGRVARLVQLGPAALP